MRWTCDEARAQYERIQTQISTLAEQARKANNEAITLQLEARRLLGTHTLPSAGVWAR